MISIIFSEPKDLLDRLKARGRVNYAFQNEGKFLFLNKRMNKYQ